MGQSSTGQGGAVGSMTEAGPALAGGRRAQEDPTRAAFREGFRAWLRRTLPEGWMAAVETGDDEALEDVRGGIDFLTWPGIIGPSGYGAPLWPRAYGGLSGEAWMVGVVRDELSRWRLPQFGLNLLGVGMAGPTIIEHGTDDQRRRHLPRILSGEEIWCQLFSEPGAGSDLASLSTRAVRHGEAWVVHGQKVWTTIAQFAHYGMLLARTDPDVPKHEGLTYLICDLHAAGVEVRPLRQMTGAAEFNEVFFSEVVIPDTQRVGEVGDGWRVARTTLMNERVALAGVTLDPAALFGGRRRDPWRSYLERVPTRNDPVVRDRLARLYLEARLKEVTTARAEAARSAGRRPGPEGGVGKVVNAEHARRRGEVAVDAAGAHGIAQLPGDDVAEGREQAFLRSRAATIEGGTSEVLRNQIGEAILGLPREPEVDKGVPWHQIRRSSP